VSLNKEVTIKLWKSSGYESGPRNFLKGEQKSCRQPNLSKSHHTSHPLSHRSRMVKVLSKMPCTCTPQTVPQIAMSVDDPCATKPHGWFTETLVQLCAMPFPISRDQNTQCGTANNQQG